MTKSIDLSVRSIAVTVDAVWGPLFLAIAAQLKKERQSAVHVYVRTKDEYLSYRQMNHGQWDSVTQYDLYSQALQQGSLNEKAVVARAVAHENRLGDTISTFTFNHRQFGRGFSFGSFYYPRAPGFESISYISMLHAYNEMLDFWQREVDAKGISLFLHGDKEQAATARANGIQFRRLDVSRYKNFWYWTPNEFFFNPAVEADYAALNDEHLDAVFDQGYAMSTVKNQSFLQRASLAKTVYNSINAAVRYTGWKLLRRRKAESYRFFDFVTFGFREYAAFRQMIGKRVVSLDQMRGSRFVYFPLHKEPEFSLQLMSPEYFNQHAAIVSVARDLPAGVRLAVKENLWSLGRRPRNFYDQVVDLKNVVFVDVREPGLEMAKASEAVVSITGTAGFEAAVLGKPVITFGRHNMYSLLDHCMTVIDEKELRGYLNRVFDHSIDLAKARRDGARFLRAVLRSSFDMGDWAVVGVGKDRYRNFGDIELKRAVDGLLASFAMPNLNQISSLTRAAEAKKQAS